MRALLILVLAILAACDANDRKQVEEPAVPADAAAPSDEGSDEASGEAPAAEPPEAPAPAPKPLSEDEARFLKSVQDVFVKAKSWPPPTAKIDADLREHVRKRFLQGVEERRFAVHRIPGFRFVIEVNRGWDEDFVTRRRCAEPVTQMRAAFRGLLGFPEPEREPVTDVVLLKDQLSYAQYRIGRFGKAPMGFISAYEADTNRLAFHSNAEIADVLHEAVSMEMDRIRKVAAPDGRRVAWIHAGLAEWFSTHRRRAEEGKWEYDFGFLPTRGIRQIGFLVKNDRLPSLEELLGLRAEIVNGRLADVPYGSGKRKLSLLALTDMSALLVHFLMHFDMDGSGVVRIGTAANPVKGRYQDGFRRYVRFVLEGKDGKLHDGKAAFMEALALDDAGFQELSRDSTDYLRFVLKKVRLGQVRDKRLVPWTEWTNRLGVKAGRVEDDRLRQPK